MAGCAKVLQRHALHVEEQARAYLGGHHCAQPRLQVFVQQAGRARYHRRGEHQAEDQRHQSELRLQYCFVNQRAEGLALCHLQA